MQRTVVIGNGGSGKSTLARLMGARFDVMVVDLDLLHWKDDGRKRDEAAARRLTADAASGQRWVIEGVYGWLAKVAVPRATALVWLDLPWSECRAGLLACGPRRGDSESDFAELLAWSEAYWTRTTSSSFTGHAQIYESYSAAKWRLTSRDAVRAFVADLT
ncbi:MAG TPA: adenylate kinase [Alphaproteobacteria bacterium]|nr:adenylate kinase [Alphaproteobacteria bacterium]